MSNHSDTTTRRTYNVSIRLEDFQETLGQWPRIIGAPCIGHGLSATRLGRRKFDLHSVLSKHIDRGKGNLWIELVDVTGNKQGGVHAGQVDQKKGRIRNEKQACQVRSLLLPYRELLSRTTKRPSHSRI